jgi:transposase
VPGGDVQTSGAADEAAGRSERRHEHARVPALNLTSRQQLKLAHIQQINQRLYRAYLLKEQLRQIYQVDPGEAIAILNAWLTWAWRCRLQPFVKLARTIRDQRPGIEAAIRHRPPRRSWRRTLPMAGVGGGSRGCGGCSLSARCGLCSL